MGIKEQFRMLGSYVLGTADKSLILASNFHLFNGNSIFYLEKQLYISSVEA